jgi:hypothetical protein
VVSVDMLVLHVIVTGATQGKQCDWTEGVRHVVRNEPDTAERGVLLRDSGGEKCWNSSIF